MSEEMPYIRETRQHLATLTKSLDQLARRANALHASDKEQTTRIAELTRLLNETEERARLAEERSDENEYKATRSEKIDEAARKLIAALDRLPTSMEDASIVPGAVKPEILLYGTYEWQSVADAKYWLQQQMKERRVM